MLIERGADIHAKNDFGATPLHIASAKDIRMVQLLLDKGANVHARDNEGNTPLHVAASYKLSPSYGPEIIELLMQRGADPHIKNNAGQTGCEILRSSFPDYC